MNMGVFLDRDGVVNRERGRHTWRLEDWDLLPGVPEAIAALNRARKTVVVVSNQSGIALGLYSHKDVDVLHGYLHQQLAEHGAHIDAMYCCPHHPDHGRCLCRKPGHLLLQRAVARFMLDPRACIFIGDRERDVQAAGAVGMRGVLVSANSNLSETLFSLGVLPS
jgi:D-glycero-D-manno-heptose 1,7-bisphosphate phosphatase